MIVAGFGFRAAASLDSLQDALARASAGKKPAKIATALDKAQTPVFKALAASSGCPALGIDETDLNMQSIQTHSDASHRTRGTGSVSEAAALAAAGPGALLIAPRVVSRDGMATCALAQMGQGDPS